MEITGWINLTLVLAVLATLLHVAGFVAPMWIWLDVGSFRVGVGLWFTTGCGLQGTCDSAAPTVSFGYTTADTWSAPQFNAVRGLETIAVAGAVLLLLFLIVYRLGYGKWTQMEQLNVVAFLTAVVCWLCILAGLITYCAYYWPVVGTSPLINHQSFPWSLVMCLLAAFLFIVVCILIRAKCREKAYLKHAIPISGDSKMDMHPVTKHGLLHRYFSPLYRGIRGNTDATGYGGKSAQNMNTRLIGAEERNRVAAVDNVAFYGNARADANNANYRYLPTQNGHHHHNHDEPGFRRTLPTAVVTYTDTNITDINRIHQHQQQQTNGFVGSHHQNGVASNQVGGGRDSRYPIGGVGNPAYEREGVMRDNLTYSEFSRNVAHHSGGGGGGVGGAAAHRHGEGEGGRSHSPSPRDRAGNMNVDDSYTYTTVKKPVITTTTTYVTEETRDLRSDSRFANEGYQKKGGLTVTELESNDGNQHVSKYFTTTTLASRAGSEQIKPYDPTYIYRPYSETEPPKPPVEGERL